MKHRFIPPRSPYSLIQEDMWPDTWMILVCCVMLNQTSRKQVEKVLPDFVKRWPTPQAFVSADPNDVAAVIKPLGFCNRRTKNLLAMTERFLSGPWEDARELPGIGEYGGRAFEIFCLGKLGDVAPNDHALTQYWHWAVALNSPSLCAL